MGQVSGSADSHIAAITQQLISSRQADMDKAAKIVQLQLQLDCRKDQGGVLLQSSWTRIASN